MRRLGCVEEEDEAPAPAGSSQAAAAAKVCETYRGAVLAEERAAEVDRVLSSKTDADVLGKVGPR